MSLYEDMSPVDFDDVVALVATYRRRIKKARGIVLRAIESSDYTHDTFCDLLEALEGEYDS